MIDEIDESWLPIWGYEDLYEVSDHGRVRSIKGGIVKEVTRSRGGAYLKVGLTKDGVISHLYVHRLVAAAFVDNFLEVKPGTRFVVKHRSKDNLDNRYENLMFKRVRSSK